MSDTGSNQVTVTILGKPYTIAPDQDQSAEQIQEVARLADETMRQLQQQKPHQSQLQTAILAGLNLVDELFKMQVDYQSAESDIAQRTSRLTASLGRVFQDVEIDSGQSSG